MPTQPSETVVYCVDTNILLEFVALEDIPWRTLAPGAELVRVIIPTKVGEEMDAHKRKTGRLHRRAIQFNQLARRMEEQPDGIVALRESAPKVTVEFGPLFRKSDLDADQFELEDNDNRIVAEVFAISRKIPNAVLLADDSKPIRLARQAGLSFARPSPEWRRQDGPDEKDIKISNLKRELGAHPILCVTIACVDDQKRIVIEDSPEAANEDCLKAFLEAVLETEPKASRESLIDRYGLHSPSRYNLGTDLYEAPGITNSQLDQYDEDYQRFSRKTAKIATVLHKVLSCLSYSLHVNIDVGNDGDRAAEKVVVEAEVTPPFKFSPIHKLSKELSLQLKAPTPPKPNKGMLDFSPSLPNLLSQLAPPRVDTFHRVDEVDPTSEKTTSWRCEELRHGVNYSLPILIVADDQNAKGVLTVTASSAVLAKKTILHVPLETRAMDSVADAKYFLERLPHIPKIYRDAFREKLMAL